MLLFSKVANKLMRTLLYNMDFEWANRQYIKLVYKRNIGRSLNFRNPMAYTEKLQYLKLYDHNPLYTKLVDKVLVKNYVTEIIGAEYVIPTIEVWNSADEVELASLPNCFVMKCNHDSGSVIICTDKEKINIDFVKRKMNKALKCNLYKPGREWPYKDVEPKILVEEMLECGDAGLNDYKVLCFGGKAYCTEYHMNRFLNHTQDFYSRDWTKIAVVQGTPNSNIIIDKPPFYEKMIELSEKLAQNIPHVRVDWYYVNNKLYFGEMTFFDSGGFTGFEPVEFDYELGKQITLPDRKEKD